MLPKFVLRTKQRIDLFVRIPVLVGALASAFIFTFALLVIDNYQLFDYRFVRWTIGPGSLVALVPGFFYWFEMNLLPVTLTVVYYSLVFYQGFVVRSWIKKSLVFIVVICINTLSFLIIETFLEI